MQVDTNDKTHFANVLGISIADLDDILTFSNLTGASGARISWKKWSTLLNFRIDIRVTRQGWAPDGSKKMTWFNVNNVEDVTAVISSPNDLGQAICYDSFIDAIEGKYGTRYWLHNHRLPVDVAGVIQSCKLYKESLYYKYIICV